MARRSNDSFARPTGITVDYQIYDFVTYTEMRPGLLLDPNAPSASSGYDVLLTSTSALGDVASIPGKLPDLSGLLRLEGMVDGDLGNFRTNGIMYDGAVRAVPLAQSALLLLYDREVFAADNVTVPQTWDEAADLAERYHGRDNRAGICALTVGCRAESFLLRAILGSYVQSQGSGHGVFWDPSTLEPLVRNEAMERALMIFLRLRAAGPTESDAPLCRPTSFIRGQCFMAIASGEVFKSGSVGAKELRAMRGRMGFAPLPGSDRVLDRSTGSLVPCDEARCPHAFGTTAEGVPVNRPVALTSLVLLVNGLAPFTDQFFGYQLAAYLASPAVIGIEGLLLADNELLPVRAEDMAPSTLPAWAEAGYDGNDTLGFLDAWQQVVTSRNINGDLRIHYAQNVTNALTWAATALLDLGLAPSDPTLPGTVAAVTHGLNRLLGEVVDAIGGAEAFGAEYRRSLPWTPPPPPAPGDPRAPLPPGSSVLFPDGSAGNGGGGGGGTQRTLAAFISACGGALLLAAVLAFVLRRRARRRGLAARLRGGAVKAPGAGSGTTLCCTDIENSTAYWEELSEAMNVALDVHHGTVRRLLAEHGGYECLTEGDSFVAAFHTACSALDFCMELQKALLEAPWPQELLAFRPAPRSGQAEGGEEEAFAQEVVATRVTAGFSRTSAGSVPSRWLKRNRSVLGPAASFGSAFAAPGLEEPQPQSQLQLQAQRSSNTSSDVALGTLSAVGTGMNTSLTGPAVTVVGRATETGATAPGSMEPLWKLEEVKRRASDYGAVTGAGRYFAGGGDSHETSASMRVDTPSLLQYGRPSYGRMTSSVLTASEAAAAIASPYRDMGPLSRSLRVGPLAPHGPYPSHPEDATHLSNFRPSNYASVPPSPLGPPHPVVFHAHVPTASQSISGAPQHGYASFAECLTSPSGPIVPSSASQSGSVSTVCPAALRSRSLVVPPTPDRNSPAGAGVGISVLGLAAGGAGTGPGGVWPYGRYAAERYGSSRGWNSGSTASTALAAPPSAMSSSLAAAHAQADAAAAANAAAHAHASMATSPPLNPALNPLQLQQQLGSSLPRGLHRLRRQSHADALLANTHDTATLEPALEGSHEGGDEAADVFDEPGPGFGPGFGPGLAPMLPSFRRGSSLPPLPASMMGQSRRFDAVSEVEPAVEAGVCEGIETWHHLNENPSVSMPFSIHHSRSHNTAGASGVLGLSMAGPIAGLAAAALPSEPYTDRPSGHLPSSSYLHHMGLGLPAFGMQPPYFPSRSGRSSFGARSSFNTRSSFARSSFARSSFNAHGSFARSSFARSSFGGGRSTGIRNLVETLQRAVNEAARMRPSDSKRHALTFTGGWGSPPPGLHIEPNFTVAADTGGGGGGGGGGAAGPGPMVGGGWTVAALLRAQWSSHQPLNAATAAAALAAAEPAAGAPASGGNAVEGPRSGPVSGPVSGPTSGGFRTLSGPPGPYSGPRTASSAAVAGPFLTLNALRHAAAASALGPDDGPNSSGTHAGGGTPATPGGPAALSTPTAAAVSTPTAAEKAGSSAAAAASVVAFRGLRVRAGLSCGVQSETDIVRDTHNGRTQYSGTCMRVARLVSDAALGGMVLLSECAKDQLEAEAAEWQGLVRRHAPITLWMGLHRLAPDLAPVHLYQVMLESLIARLALLQRPLRTIGPERPLAGVLPAPAFLGAAARICISGAATLLAWDAKVVTEALELFHGVLLEELRRYEGRVYVLEGAQGLLGGGGGGKGACPASCKDACGAGVGVSSGAGPRPFKNPSSGLLGSSRLRPSSGGDSRTAPPASASAAVPSGTASVSITTSGGDRPTWTLNTARIPSGSGERTLSVVGRSISPTPDAPGRTPRQGATGGGGGGEKGCGRPGVMTVVFDSVDAAATWLLRVLDTMPLLDWPIELLEHPLCEPMDLELLPSGGPGGATPSTPTGALSLAASAAATAAAAAAAASRGGAPSNLNTNPGAVKRGPTVLVGRSSLRDLFTGTAKTGLRRAITAAPRTMIRQIHTPASLSAGGCSEADGSHAGAAGSGSRPATGPGMTGPAGGSGSSRTEPGSSVAGAAAGAGATGAGRTGTGTGTPRGTPRGSPATRMSLGPSSEGSVSLGPISGPGMGPAGAGSAGPSSAPSLRLAEPPPAHVAVTLELAAAPAPAALDPPSATELGTGSGTRSPSLGTAADSSPVPPPRWYGFGCGGRRLSFSGLRASGVLSWGDLNAQLPPPGSLTGHLVYRGKAWSALGKLQAKARVGQVVTNSSTLAQLHPDAAALVVEVDK
ncbi:hypothetical protein HYH03_013839 [Edaphochlamys debaryana]|uniref:Guanylate cyclase domain-containing protein n=1 Tax=Edaphochlamys debaryana TaxID=47281 RepID=A0A835XQ27_9CHLO|nr:hypothetical protein HYH03_013839 [Edaphochlamys debaryana]|eukprot:KAG2487560.1 hypothetical protein HYH03_013839 [Edaphochlamys debaryana]